MCDTRSKSTNRQGVKQTPSTSSSTSTSTEKSGPICWNCGEAGHLKCNCPNPPYCSKCKQKGHLPVKCPLKGKRKETSQMPQRARQTPVDQRFSNIRNKCIHCGGDHASGMRPTRMQSQTAPSTVGYMVYNGSTGAGKTNNNASLLFSTQNGQSATGSTTPSSLANNSTGAQGRVSCTQAPQVTPQVSPDASQQNSYNIPPMQLPNQFPPPPYFPIPFPPPPIAPSNVSNAHSAPVSDISATITLMTNAVTQGNSNTTAITNALERTTMQFADALQRRHKKTKIQGWTSNLRRLRYSMVLDHSNVTHGWKRYTPCVSKQEGLSTKCCYYVQFRLSATSSRTCPLM